jgi:peroxiredoxin
MYRPFCKAYFIHFILIVMVLPVNAQSGVEQVFEKVRTYDFHPLMQGNSMTFDRDLETAGIADLGNEDWKVRLIAVRDLVGAGEENINEIIGGLYDTSIHVKQVAASALGILSAEEAIEPLEQIVMKDDNAMVRSQAVISLGQIESEHSLDLLRKAMKEDSSRDVRHQCELALYQIEHHMGASEKLRKAFLMLDETVFETGNENGEAPDFILEDTDGAEWQLSEFRNKKWVVLIWVFADWCPVCHGEFHDLMEIRDQFEEAEIQVFTLETHDTYRGRVMVGKEIDPEYWFAKESFKEAYTNNIWWPHLIDRAGGVAAVYGADPFAFAVHAEYINRPTTVIIDKDGMIRFLYRGTFWGDRPTIEQTIEMIKKEDFAFENPLRLKREQ